jgi:hypothetical protein
MADWPGNTAWYTRSAQKADLEYGRRMVDLVLEQLRTEIASV